jgi:hypothetical protein
LPAFDSAGLLSLSPLSLDAKPKEWPSMYRRIRGMEYI